MQAIVAILRASHCKSTHHFFAIDAIEEVRSENGRRLGKMLLSHFKHYLRGTKDPDIAFKDFENHVVHVRDGFWGGAAKTAERWRLRIREELSQKKWADAAYSIGVLSHYFSDPFMPLHTGQTARESIVHRPLEWSVCCAYQQIYQLALSDLQLQSFEIPSGESWLTDSIHAGALLANKYYESLMDEYDMGEAHRHPTLALPDTTKKSLAQIFVWVLTAWGGALDRLALESNLSIPEFSLALPTLMATVEMPIQRIVASLANIQQRNEVAAILDEYLKTGKVVSNQTLEYRKVKSVKQLSPTFRPSALEIDRLRPVHTTPFIAKSMEWVECNLPVTPHPIQSKRIQQEHPSFSPITPKERHTERARETRQGSDGHAGITRLRRVTVNSPIVDAPAIGPKTAAKLEAIGIHSIGDLLNNNAHYIASQLRTKWITTRRVEAWQVQSQLSIEIPGLTASGAGLLALTGIVSSTQLSSMSIDTVYDQISGVAQTAEGMRILRNKTPPSRTQVARWHERCGLKLSHASN